jgi:cell division protein FtsN
VSANITGAAASSSTTEPNQKPTSAVVNIIYAIQFPVLPSPGLSTGAIVGIGVGGGIAIIVLSLLLVWRTRKHKKDLTAMQQREGQIANGQSQNGMSEATLPYAYLQQTELETHGAPQAVLKPGGFVPQEQNGYFQQQQTQQGQPSQYYGQQPGLQIQQSYRQQPAHQMQGQSPVQYQSPVASTVSPQPTGLDGYSQQTGYAGTIPSSTGSPPLQEGYGYQSSYAAPVSELGPNSAGYSTPGSVTYVSPNPTGSPAPGEGYGSQGGYNPTGNELHHPQT